MSWSPLIDQRTQTPDGPEDCGETTFAMVAEHLGHNVTERQVLTIHYGPTDENMMLAFCKDFGLTGCYLTKAGFDNDDKIVMALIHDNSNADPAANGPYLHWIVVYGQDSRYVYCANPWGGRDVAYPLSQFNPAYIAGIVIPVAANTVIQPAPPPPHDTVESDMANIVSYFWAEKQEQHIAQLNKSGDIWAKVYPGKNADGSVRNGWDNQRLTVDGAGKAIPISVSQGVTMFETPGQLHIAAEGAQDGLIHHWWGDGRSWTHQLLS